MGAQPYRPSLPSDSIFVQIASYRDPELIPTLVDLIARSSNPRRLRIVVCWQHADDEPLAAFWRQGFGKWRREKTAQWDVHHLDCVHATIELIDVPHLATQGACWARNQIQQRYAGERYTLQLDSHHRFVDRWDAELTAMLESLRDESAKPLLTSYLPSYHPGSTPRAAGSDPLTIAFEHFSEEGVALFRPKPLAGWQALARPVPARFYSAHFAFADGHFAHAVQHDPAYFFHGEEISISVRAFTHGYDLYHPHRVLAWHEYSRTQRVKVWDDHSVRAQQQSLVDEAWGKRNERAMQRNREMFGIDGTPLSAARFDRYGFGMERTVADYEAYAGLCFARRGVQPALLNDTPPVRARSCALSTTQPDDASNAPMKRSNDLRICQHRDAFDRCALVPGAQPRLAAAHAARVAVYDARGVQLVTDTLDAARLASHRSGDWLDCRIVFLSDLDRIPARYVVELTDDAGELLSRIEQTLER